MEKLILFWNKNRALSIIFLIFIAGLTLVLFPEKTDEKQSDFSYEEMLEEKLVDIVSEIEGVSNVKILLTLSENTSESPKGAEVKGVAVVCSKGDDYAIQKKIISVVSASVGVKSNKISVCE